MTYMDSKKTKFPQNQPPLYAYSCNLSQFQSGIVTQNSYCMYDKPPNFFPF